MTADKFLSLLQKHSASFAKAVATNEGDWIIKGFIDVYSRIYSSATGHSKLRIFVQRWRKWQMGISCMPTRLTWADMSIISILGAKPTSPT